MSFAEQLALASRKKNIDIVTAITASNNSSPSSATSANNDNNAALSFTNTINNKSVSTPTTASSTLLASDATTPSAKITPPARRPPPLQPVSSPSVASSFADELHKKSQGGRRKKVTYSNSNIIEEQVVASRNNNTQDDNDEEYSAVGFSLKSPPKREETSNNASNIGASKKWSSGNKKKLKPVKIVPSEPSVGEQNEEGGNYLRGTTLPQSPPLHYQQQQHQSRNLPQHQIINHQSHNTNNNVTDNSDDNNNKVFGAWAQIESLKRRVHEAEERARLENQRAEMASYELELVRDNRSTPTISNIDNGGKSIYFGDENDDVTARGGADSTILSPLSVSSQKCEIDEWRKRAVEAEERLLAQRSYEQQQIRIERLLPEKHQLLSLQQQQEQQRQHLLSAPPQSTTQSSVCTTPRGLIDEESSIELIRLKNAEIDVLRSQIHRLERRIQEECGRTEGEDLLSHQRQSRNHHYHFDGSASSCTGPPSVVGDDVGRDELRLLRNEIQNLQYQLRRQDTATTNNLTGKSSCGKGNNISASTTGSTLSSLDENENQYDEGEEEVDDDEDDDGGGDCCSSWGLCCVRRRPRRRGYGRV